MSQDRNHVNHATWECKYHVVFTSKYRKKLLSGRSGGTWALYVPGACQAQGMKIEEGQRAAQICSATNSGPGLFRHKEPLTWSGSRVDPAWVRCQYLGPAGCGEPL
jgi:hypothetical protein